MNRSDAIRTLTRRRDYLVSTIRTGEQWLRDHPDDAQGFDALSYDKAEAAALDFALRDMATGSSGGSGPAEGLSGPRKPIHDGSVASQEAQGRANSPKPVFGYVQTYNPGKPKIFRGPQAR